VRLALALPTRRSSDLYIYGQIAAANALSDVYAMGGAPRTALNLVGYPDDKEDLDWLGEILRGGAERCQAAGAENLPEPVEVFLRSEEHTSELQSRSDL